MTTDYSDYTANPKKILEHYQKEKLSNSELFKILEANSHYDGYNRHKTAFELAKKLIEINFQEKSFNQNYSIQKQLVHATWAIAIITALTAIATAIINIYC